MRVFIAFQVNKEVRNQLHRLQLDLQALNRRQKLRWTNPVGFHVTVEFLGQKSLEEVKQISAVLDQVAAEATPFNLWLARIGGFPNASAPKVIHVRVQDEKNEAARLRHQILLPLGISEKAHPWQPHITVARNPQGKYVDGLSLVKCEPITWGIESMYLIKSELQPNGPKYTIISTHNFGQAKL